MPKIVTQVRNHANIIYFIAVNDNDTNDATSQVFQ